MPQNHYAVVVGIDRYPSMPSDRALQYARHDAICFYKWLRSSNGGGVPKGNAKLITATRTEQASGVARPVRKEVFDFLTDIHKRIDGIDGSEWLGSRLYVYLTGHGIAPVGGGGALLFADSDPPYRWEYFDLDVCESYYKRCRFFNEIVLLGDFCRDVDSAVPPAAALEFGTCYGESELTRRVVAYATPITQQASEPEDGPIVPPANGTHPQTQAPGGFFTQAVLDGLRGEATPHPITGIIDIGRLVAYVRPLVRQLSGQDIDISPANAEDLVLARCKPPTYPVDLLVPEGFHEPIRLVVWEHGNELVMGQWAQSNPRRWSVDLPASRYQAVADSAGHEHQFSNDGSFMVPGSPGKDTHEPDRGALVVPL
jgi:hypothetical protein